MFVYLKNNSIQLTLSSIGARMVSLKVPDKAGNWGDIIQGYDTEKEYSQKEKSQGALCGRFANRIANAEFEVNGELFLVPKNDGNNCLHGGDKQLRLADFEVDQINDEEVIFSYFSPDMEEGFPGNVTVKIIYTLINNQLRVSLQASTDKDTPLNLTLHPYFNLNNEGNGQIFDHELMVPSSQIVEINEECLPTGRLITTEHGPFDFRKLRVIGVIPELNEPQIDLVQGYDHCFVLSNWLKIELKHNATLQSIKSGRKLTIESDYPGLQVYTANTQNDQGKQNKSYRQYSAICLEPQYFPDSPNQPNFPFYLTTSQKPYQQSIHYTFEILN